MKWILFLISVLTYSFGQGQIALDSGTYYSLIRKNSWVQEDIIERMDSLTNNEIEWSKIVIDSNYYWFPDSQLGVCIRFPMNYKLKIENNVFQLSVKNACKRNKFDFYVYGWFIDLSTLKLIHSNKKLTPKKLANKIPETYANI